MEICDKLQVQSAPSSGHTAAGYQLHHGYWPAGFPGYHKAEGVDQVKTPQFLALLTSVQWSFSGINKSQIAAMLAMVNLQSFIKTWLFHFTSNFLLSSPHFYYGEVELQNPVSVCIIFAASIVSIIKLKIPDDSKQNHVGSIEELVRYSV